jgi:hypothetical protein
MIRPLRLPIAALCAATALVGGETSPLGAAAPAAPPLQWGSRLLQAKPGWYASAEARTAADTILCYQSDFMQVGYERRSGYNYPTTAPATLLERDYPAWRARRSTRPSGQPKIPNP